MKLKTSITTILLAVGILSSCSKETLIEQDDNNLVTDVSVVFAVADAKTKAPDNSEMTLNDIFVALYDSEQNLIGSQQVANPEYEMITVQGSPSKVPVYAVTLKNIRTGKDGKKVYAVVVANSGLSFSNGIQEETVTTDSFIPAGLVKAGKSEIVTLTALTAENAKPTTIRVPMTQLSARIDFAGVTTDNKNLSFTPTSVTFSGGNKKTRVSIYDNNTVENDSFSPLDNISNIWNSKNIPFYTYEYTEGLNLNLTVKGKFSTNPAEKSFVLNISNLLKENNLKLTKGHQYTITGTCPSNVSTTIHWAIVEADKIIIDIPEFK